VRGLGVAGLVLAVTLLVGGGTLVLSQAADAAPVPSTGSGRLKLDAQPWPLPSSQDIAAGDTEHWVAAVGADDQAGAPVMMTPAGFGAMGTDPAGLQVAIDACGTAWVLATATCPSADARPLLASGSVSSARSFSIGRASMTTPVHLLITLSLPPTAGTRFVGETGAVRLVFAAEGDTATLSSDPPSSLARTGALVGGPALLAAGLLLGGASLAVLRPRRGVTT